MISFGIAIILNLIFLLTYHTIVTFKKKGKIILFMLLNIFLTTLSWILLYILTEEFLINYIIAIIPIAGVVSVINYVLNKNLVFKAT